MRTRYIVAGEGGIDPTDRGLAYGDGLFETMSVRAGGIERLALHLDRLREGCARLELPVPAEAELEQRIAESAAGIERGTLKLILTRGIGPRGFTPPAAAVPSVILLPEARYSAPVSGISVTMLGTRLGENEKLAGIKHLNRLEQVLGRLELGRLGADEGLMSSTGGTVIGGTSRNLFAVFGDRVVTPAVDRAGIAGVMRRAVLEQCAALGIEAAEATLAPADLLRADELFMTNALVGIQSVARLDRTAFGSQTIARRLSAALGFGEAKSA